MGFSLEDKIEYAGWLKSLIAQEMKKKDDIFRNYNISQLNRDLSNINREINKN